MTSPSFLVPLFRGTQFHRTCEQCDSPEEVPASFSVHFLLLLLHLQLQSFHYTSRNASERTFLIHLMESLYVSNKYLQMMFHFILKLSHQPYSYFISCSSLHTGENEKVGLLPQLQITSALHLSFG